MKRYLILGVLAVCGASQAGAPAVLSHPVPAAASGAKPAAAAPRHLSDAERAELRRQLQEFNRLYINKHR